MELKSVLTLVLLSLAAACYAKQSRLPRTLWLDEDSSTYTETDKKISLFDQVHIGDHAIKRPFFANRPNDQKGNQLKFILDKEKKMAQNFVGRNDDYIKNYQHQQNILDKKDNPKNLDDIMQVLSDILEENVEEYLKNYCATRYITHDYRICLLFCILSHQPNKKDGEFPPPFPQSQNTYSVTSLKHDSRRQFQQIQDAKGALFDQKHVKTKMDQIPVTGSNAKILPNLIKNINQRNYEGLKRSKRWTQSASNLLPNTNISGISN